MSVSVTGGGPAGEPGDREHRGKAEGDGNGE